MRDSSKKKEKGNKKRVTTKMGFLPTNQSQTAKVGSNAEPRLCSGARKKKLFKKLRIFGPCDLLGNHVYLYISRFLLARQ